MLRVPFLSPEAPLAIIAVTLLLIVILGPLKPMRRSLINTSVFFFACLLGDLLAGFLSGGITSKAAAGWLRQLAVFGEGLAVIRFAGLAFFNVALPRINLRISGILADILVIIGYIGWGFFRLQPGRRRTEPPVRHLGHPDRRARHLDAGHPGQPARRPGPANGQLAAKSATGSRSTTCPARSPTSSGASPPCSPAMAKGGRAQ